MTAAWMQRDHHSESGWSERGQKPHGVARMWDLDSDSKELIHEAETDSGMDRTGWWLPRGREMEGEQRAGWGQHRSAFLYRLDQLQGPAGSHRELYSVSYGKPWWERIKKK